MRYEAYCGAIACDERVCSRQCTNEGVKFDNPLIMARSYVFWARNQLKYTELPKTVFKPPRRSNPLNLHNSILSRLDYSSILSSHTRIDPISTSGPFIWKMDLRSI